MSRCCLRLNTNLVVAFILVVFQFFFSPLSLAQKSELPERLKEFSPHKYTPKEIEGMFPTTPNPWLSIRPDGSNVDWNYWRVKQSMDAQKRAMLAPQAQMRMTAPRWSFLPFTFIPRFGTGKYQNDSVEITGDFDLPAPDQLTPLPEDEGSIPLATEINLDAGNAIVVDSVIGDGPFGSAGTGSGDIDFYVVRNVKQGQTITVDLDTSDPFGPLDPYVEIYNSAGEFLAANDDGDPAVSFDSFLMFTAPADDDYYISIAGFGTFFLADPFDSSSGLGNIFGLPLDEGEYTATIGLDYFDDQTFAFVLKPGEVFGASVSGNTATLSLSDRRRTERQGSAQDLSFILPAVSPLPGGLVSVNHVVDKFGLFRLRVRGIVAGSYTLQLKAALPALREGVEGDVQTIFLDFDGETVDLAESLFIGAPPGQFIRTLSPLSAFLSDWGLTDADEDEVIDAIVKVVKRSLVKDIRRKGRNRDFKIRLLNSRDHQDPFGMANVSRVIVGGTIAELGISTIGIAQSIDVGNFDTNETAFVLLDVLSSTNPFSSVSLNNFPIDPSSSKAKLIGVGVGEIVAHEAGHYLGNWHTDQFNEQPNIMDQGGNLPFSVLGIGDDGIFGTGDDVDVMFGRDEFVPNEGFTGVQNTLTTISYGATQPDDRHGHSHH